MALSTVCVTTHSYLQRPRELQADLTLPLSEETVTWIEKAFNSITSAYKSGSWSSLEHEIATFPYAMNDISGWPMDGVAILVTPAEACFLGSLKAACSLDAIYAIHKLPINVVLTACMAELHVKGTPSSWEFYFARQGVTHLCVDVDDLRADVRRTPERFVERANALLASCLDSCYHLWYLREQCKQQGIFCSTLFHCFGGIHRSSALLCAWLIVGHDLSCDKALAILLTKRPALCPWSGRGYVLWVLHYLSCHREIIAHCIHGRCLRFLF